MHRDSDRKLTIMIQNHILKIKSHQTAYLTNIPNLPLNFLKDQNFYGCIKHIKNNPYLPNPNFMRPDITSLRISAILF